MRDDTFVYAQAPPVVGLMKSVVVGVVLITLAVDLPLLKARASPPSTVAHYLYIYKKDAGLLGRSQPTGQESKTTKSSPYLQIFN